MKKSILVFLLFAAQFSSYGQCDLSVPQFAVNLSSNSDSTWTSPSSQRAGNCCGTVAPDNCISFTLTLASDAQGIVFDVCGGALPPGALFYQVDCGPPQAVGNILCLSGQGPFEITFCKPGNNTNQYCITSIPDPSGGPDLSVNDGCVDSLSSSGLQDSSIVWTSIFPGAAGSYDSLLSCTQDCRTTAVRGVNNLPTFIDYQVCGILVTPCTPTFFCDTIRVSFFNSLRADITPVNPTVCFGQTNTWINANPTGGSPPYSILWSTTETTDSIQVGIGTYTVQLSDVSGCPPAFDTVTVTDFNNPILADAGPNRIICQQDLPLQLNGVIQAASGGKWSGGNGSYFPNDSTLNANYQPSSTEISNGSITFFLTTTGNGTCPADVDTLIISLEQFSGIINTTASNVSCNGSNDGSAAISISGGNSPFTYQWDMSASSQTTATVANLSLGVYLFTVTDANGCTKVDSVTITEPSILTSAIGSATNVSCNSGSDGSASVTVAGGTTPYSYAWPSGDTTANDTGLSQGTYIVTVTDANGCTSTSSITINEPSVLSSTISSSVDVSCNGGSDGTASVTVNGGTAPYSYTWPSGTPTATETGLSPGTYVVTVTDFNNCTTTSSVTITEPNVLSSAIATSTNVSCNGGADGTASITVTGGTAPYSYAWPSGDTTANDSGLTQGTYVVTITDFNNCTDTSSVVITEPNLLTSTISATTAVSCNGGADGTATVSASGGTAPYSYSWPSRATTAIDTGLTQGTYIVTVTDSLGCSSTSNVLITQPASLQMLAEKDSVSCFGSADGQIIVTPIGGTSPYTFNWSNSSTDSINSGLSAGNYQVTVTDFRGCLIDSAFTIEQPDLMVLTVSPNDTICIGNSTDIQATATGGNFNYTYIWNNNLPDSNFHQVNPSIQTVYTVSVRDDQGCVASEDSIIIAVRDLSRDILTAFKSGNICVGESVDLTATHNGSLGGYGYTWSNNVGNGLGPISVSPTTTTQYIVSAFDECGTIISDSIDVIVESYPIVSLPAIIDEGCEPLTVNFVDSINGATNNLTYLWDLGNGATSSSSNFNYTYTNDGTYSIGLKISSPMGCETNSSNQSQVVVYQTPKADFQISPDITDLNSPIVAFINTSVNSDNVQWNFYDSFNSIKNDTSIQFNDTGWFPIKLVAYSRFGCKDSIFKNLRINPVYELKIPNAFTPSEGGGNGGFFDKKDLSNDVFYVHTELVIEYELLIFNRWGELVFETKDVNQGWDGYYLDKLSPQDVYVYKVSVRWKDGSKQIKTGSFTLFR